MRSLAVGVTLAAVLFAAGQLSPSAADEPAPSSTPPPQVVEVDDLVLPESLISKVDLAEVPKAIRNLDSQRVRIHAYIGFSPTGAPTSAVLVYGATRGGVYRRGYANSPVDKTIVTRLRSPQVLLTFDESVIIEGVSRVRPIMRDAKLKFLFFLEDAVATSSEPRNGYHNSVRREY